MLGVGGMIEVGKVFAGRYRVLGEIARGGMGAVFRAEHVETEQALALKILFPVVLTGSGAVERFRLEARVASRLKNDHVVAVHDAGIDAETGLAFLAMELLSGQTLQARVDSRGSLGTAELAALMVQLGDALDSAHGYVDKSGERHPIVHRDLKPDNLFITARSSGEPLLKVLDFGIAKVLAGSGTVSREARGTPLYMAFEQVAGDKIDPRTDIWAVGLIAFFALCQHHYWRNAEADTATALYGEILHGELEPASVRAAQLGVTTPLPEGFDAWFARCVVRKPEQRFGSAREACNALARLLDATVRIPERQSFVLARTLDASPDVALAATVASPSVSTDPRRTGVTRRRAPWLIAAGALLSALALAMFLGRSSPTGAAAGGGAPLASYPSAPAAPPPSAPQSASTGAAATAPASAAAIAPASAVIAAASASIAASASVGAPKAPLAPKPPSAPKPSKSVDVWEER